MPPIADASLTTLAYARETTSETNTITSGGTPSSGTFTITAQNITSNAIQWNTTAAQAQTVLDAAFGAGTVVVTGGGTGANFGTAGHVLTLNWAGGRFQGMDIAISITPTLTGGTATLATTQAGGVSLGYGVSPTNCGYQAVRMVSEDLGQDKEIVSSDEIVNDRRPPDNIQVGSSGSGNIVSEVIGGQNAYMDDFWMSAIGQTSIFVGQLTNTGLTSGTITAADVGGNSDRITLTHSATSWNSGFTNGAFVVVSGFTVDNAGASLAHLNSVYQVVSGGGTTAITLTRGPRVGGTKTTPTLTAGTRVDMNRYGQINDGTAVPSFSFQRQYSIASEYARLAGFCLDGFDFDMSPKRPVRVTWKWKGKEETSAASLITGTSFIAQPTNKAMGPVADMKSFSVGEDGHSFQLTAFKLSVSGGLYMQDEEAGTLGPQGVGAGTFKVTGSCEFYYEGGTLHSLYQAFTDRSIHFAMANAANEGIMFYMPRCNFTGGRRSTPGKDQAIKGRLDFTAAKGTDAFDSTTFLLRIGRR